MAENTGAGAEEEVAGQGLRNVSRSKNYYDQAAFFLNAYWNEHGKDAEEIFTICKRMAELDNKGDEGHSLDEVKSRQVLQELDMALSRQAYLDAMREIDADNDKKMSAVEFLLYKYKITPADLMKQPQTGMTDELAAANKAVKEAQDQLAALEAEKAELEKVAESGSGVAAMKARTQLSNFKVRDFKDAKFNLDKASRMVEKAMKSPDLRERGTEFMNERRGIQSSVKAAVGASALGGEDHTKVDFKDQLWQEELLSVIRGFNYKQQAGFFLNAYWEEIGEQAEVLWDYALSMAECDTKTGEEGSCLGEDKIAQFMKKNVDDYDLTATGLRQQLANEICLNNDKKMSLVEFVLNQFGLDVKELMTREQGGSSDIVRAMKLELKEIEKQTAEWTAKVKEMEEKASGTGVKAAGAKNQLAQGYGKTELDQLERRQVDCSKKLAAAENSDEITQKGYLWIMERQEQYDRENPGRR